MFVNDGVLGPNAVHRRLAVQLTADCRTLADVGTDDFLELYSRAEADVCREQAA